MLMPSFRHKVWEVGARYVTRKKADFLKWFEDRYEAEGIRVRARLHKTTVNDLRRIDGS